MGSGPRRSNTPAVESRVAESGRITCPEVGELERVSSAVSAMVGRWGQLSTDGKTVNLMIGGGVAASASNQRIAQCIQDGFDYEGVLRRGPDGFTITYRRV